MKNLTATEVIKTENDLISIPVNSFVSSLIQQEIDAIVRHGFGEQSEFDKCNQDLAIFGTSVMFDGKHVALKDLTLKAGGENFTIQCDALGPKNTALQEALEILLGLSDEDRLEVICEFCYSCGTNNNHCQCGNEE